VTGRDSDDSTIVGLFPELFDALADFGRASQELVERIEVPRKNPTGRLACEIAQHAYDALCGGAILLNHGHWRLAAGPARQIFELSLDIESVLFADEPDLAAQRYRRFGALQEILLPLAIQRTVSIDGGPDQKATDLARSLESDALTVFKEFRIKRGKEERWLESWTGKSIKQRAEASRYPLRRSEYELMFRSLSALNHAAPHTVGTLHARILTDGDPEALRIWLTKQVAEVTCLLTIFFRNVWEMGKAYLPPSTPQLHTAHERVMDLRAAAHSPSTERAHRASATDP
jgi:hypothetical protein